MGARKYGQLIVFVMIETKVHFVLEKDA